MPGFNLYTSNQQEELVKCLAWEVLETPLQNPLATELIVVQHFGMQRWLSLELTKRLDILGNTQFLFPNEFLNLLFENSVPAYQDLWKPDQLHWLLFHQLLNLPGSPEFSLIKQYQGTKRERNSFQLAKRLADLFEHYDMFRPEMLDNWESNNDEHWQALLYRELPERIRDWRKSKVRQRFQDNLLMNQKVLQGFPERVTFFGISYLPPLHLETIRTLSQSVDVHYFFLNPSPYYWGDLLPQKKIIKESLKNQKRTKDELHLEEGNPLLASWGKYGQSFFSALYDLEISNEFDRFKKDESHSIEPVPLLHQIQKDIFELISPSREADTTDFSLSEGDDSLQIHSSHSAMREVEVLKDLLLKTLSDNTIHPNDILVLTPDIEQYSPLIQAIFGGDSNDRNYIPFSITDRAFINESVVIQYFLKLFEIVKSRFTISDVLSLFGSNAVRENFTISGNDYVLLQNWLESVNIHWGIDVSFLQEKGLPPIYENTWEYGIDRILTGFSIPGDNRNLLKEKSQENDILPFDHIEGNTALVFGRFLDYFQILKDLTVGENSLFQKRSLSEWEEFLHTTVQSIFKIKPDWSDEMRMLYHGIGQLSEIEKETGFDQPIGMDPLKDFFENEFGGLFNERGYAGQGVTFAAMKPMRSLPFKVIALLGMNDKDFPRSEPKISFDLSGPYQKGDRSIKGEDRYLFLETLICARNKLLISYTGQSVKDNSTLPPSILVSELIDYLNQSYLSSDQIEQFVFHSHPLQAFSPRNFIKSGKLFSYSEQNLNAAKSAINPQKVQRTDLELKLPPPEDSFKEMTINDLVTFFDNPIKTVFNRRLGVYLNENETEHLDHEPFELDRLSEYQIEDEILNHVTHGVPKHNTHSLLKAKGVLPLSRAGTLLFNELYDGIGQFQKEILPVANQTVLDPLPYDLAIGPYSLSGSLQMVRSDYLLRFRHSGVKIKDRLKIWFEHLVINLLKPEGYPLESVLIGRDKKSGAIEIYKMAPETEPKEKLLQILNTYFNGLSEIPAIFPRTSNAFLTAYLGKIDKDEAVALDFARKSALSTWNSSYQYQGESEDPYFQLCFSRKSLLEETSFEESCLSILKPIFEKQIPWVEDD